MAISPQSQEKLAIEVARIYGEAETRLLKEIAKRLGDGIDTPSWREAKLSQIQELRERLQKEIKALEELSEETLFEIIEEAYKEGTKSADVDLKGIVRRNIDGTNITLTQETLITGSFGMVNQHAIEALARERVDLLRKANIQILRSVEDKYREIVSHSIGDVILGSETRLQATQRMLNEFANQGIKSFVDTSGRHWEMQTYAEIATRTGVGNAALQGHMDRLKENDLDLVIVSDHPEECEICRPWERRILSMSGKNKNYPSVAEARNGGLWHPRCGHEINAYVEGLTEVGTPKSDPVGYELKQQQRYNERMIRQWKRREAVALNDDELAYAKRKRIEWQKRNREFVNSNENLVRKYERESITRAR